MVNTKLHKERLDYQHRETARTVEEIMKDIVEENEKVVPDLKRIKSFYKRFTFLDFFLYGALWLLFVCFFFGYAPIDIVRALSTYHEGHC